MLLGESDVGKSHYGAQLLLRLNQKNYALRMRGAATNLDAFDEVTRALAEGKSAGHTSWTTYLESLWPVVDENGNEIDLEWPDYGGEQVRRLIDDRKVPLVWRDRLLSCDGWLLMVRIQRSGVEDDIFSRPLADILSRRAAEGVKEIRSSIQARLVELLQMLIYVRGEGTSKPLNSPALTILLSCWDELGSEGEERTPAQVLHSRLPLLSSFVKTNWVDDRVEVLGLSALEKSLQPDQADADYIDKGPENFGYVVLSDGRRDADLSLPIARLAATLAKR
ncbi:hypothetical protein [Afipia massiliensis]|uniref:TRAFAC clade GTPase domain-containing protein n=1 Tax=Afipia massiliensis TaxID=211460 RepID=UPI0024BF129A|nr:hypothetical protein [Afipia massiliensis]